MPIFKDLRYSSARVQSSHEIEERTLHFMRSPGHVRQKYVVIILSGDQRFFFAVYNGRSHLQARNLALRAHERLQLGAAEACHVLGKCQKARCKCGGKAYLFGSVRSGNSSWATYEWLLCTEAGYEGMLTTLFAEQGACRKLMRP